jgi:predicted nuclease of predicted toxin-antitoxin system
VKLLLDEMYSGAMAEQLRRRGQDAIAVVENTDLRALSDTELIKVAHLEQRAIVTANVGDFRALVIARLAGGQEHAGVLYATNRQFPTGDIRSVGSLVGALDDVLAENESLTNREIWLRSPS